MSQTPNKEQLYRMAVDAYKNGQKQPARMMFQQILQLDNRNTRAMMWLAKMAPSVPERAKWLQRVLKLEPKNDEAKKALSKIQNRDAATRNKRYFRIGAVVYVVTIILISIISIFVFSP
jgi:cytochrome c-type biogenesis protein CcmH/NrfG